MLNARKPWGMAARFVAGAFLVLAVACASRLPVPSYVQQPVAALAKVSYPPPPARAEIVPAQPKSTSVWLDGEWAWRGRRWAWRPGRWVVPPKDGHYSPWTLVRGEDGTLYFASGAWRDAKGEALAEPVALAVAKPTPGAVVNPEGEREVTGSSLRVVAGNAARAGAVEDSAQADAGASPIEGGAPRPSAGDD